MNPFGEHLLDVVTYLPLAGAIVLLFLDAQRHRAIAVTATVVAGLDLVASLPLWFAWDAARPDAHGFRFVHEANWIEQIGARYVVGVDGISMLLVLLTTVLGFVAVLSSWTAVRLGGTSPLSDSCLPGKRCQRPISPALLCQPQPGVAAVASGRSARGAGRTSVSRASRGSGSEIVPSRAPSSGPLANRGARARDLKWPGERAGSVRRGRHREPHASARCRAGSSIVPRPREAITHRDFPGPQWCGREIDPLAPQN